MDDPPSIPQSDDSSKPSQALDLDTVLASMSLSPHSPTHDESPSSPQHLPIKHNSRAILPIEDITADPNAVLGISKKTSSVYRGTWTKDGEGEKVVAVKLLKDTTVDYEHILQQIETFCALSHPNILMIFGLSPFDADPLFVVQEHMDRGCVMQYLKANQDTEATVERAQLVLETALGLAYLHSQGITHGSLKPTNILINDNGEACIADYGMVEIVPSTCAGAWRYWSPEAWKGTISPASDIYALVLSTYEILTSTPPWGVLSESQVFQLVVRESMRPDRPSSEQARKNGLGDGMWRVIERGWAQDTEERGSAEGWVKGWREGMRERDEVLVDEDAVAG